ncbi:MAG: hypothetical protein DRI54_03555 [Bacteroidetes bacterium]|nr:MAG: hypothetical protein DRI54_03555 [Bacteroidota bacterium]
MNKFLAAGFAFLFSLVLSGQGFIDDQLVPGIKAAEYVYDFYIPQNAYSDFNCPPKISKPHADTLFGFLDRLVGDNSEMEDKILQTMMDNNCRPYYTCRALNDLYLPNYLDALEKRGLSEIYGILPIAVSSSNPGYHYKNGKAGAWQLSYIVGRKFGLTIDNYIDERFDIKQSTLTAVDYLKSLENYFNGNNLLVITAFYTAVPYVKKRVERNQPFDPELFFAKLDTEVQHFLVYLNAWDKWYRHFKSTNAQKHIQKINQSLKEVVSKDTLKFEWIASFLSLNVGLIEAINPAYVGGVLYPGEQRVAFYLPQEKAKLFYESYDEILNVQIEEAKLKEQEMAELENRMKKGIPDPKTTKAINYTVRSGDVLGIIAQRYGVRVSSIKQWNNLYSDRINIGQELVIYVSKSKTDQVKKYPVVEAEKEKVDAAPKPGKGSSQTYTVKTGDSLWLIARKFPGVSAENIMEWNGISDKISPGQKLKIYKPN